MRSWTKRHTWLALGFASLLILSACGSLVNDLGETELASATLPPPATSTGAEEESPVSSPEQGTAPESAGTAKPTVVPTDALVQLEAEEGILTVDDRPARLKSVTASWNTNWNRHSIEYSELLSGGPPRDGIPPIDDPSFVSLEEAADWLADNEPVIALEIEGDARAYPLQILIWHEIVNDVVGEVPVSVTFCPLCNAAITFDRRLGDRVYDFGTSGLLRNSDLVMYDRTTESLWQQLTGEAIVGDLTGQRLEFLPSALVSFEDFRTAYTDGVVLSRDTGHRRDYGRNPYSGYDTIGQSPFLYLGDEDPRLPAMERVVTVTLAELDIAYPLSVLSELGVINDRQADQDLVVFHTPGTSSALGASRIAEAADVGATGVFSAELNGQVLTFGRDGEGDQSKIVDEQTGSSWNILGEAIDGPLAGERLSPIIHANHFWFAWAAFKPDTVIYRTR
jgi:hypothetical protein